MILRKIRQLLIGRIAILEYLLYAIVEVLLIVLGVYLAVQLNNRNEARKLKETEIQSYLEIKDDLQKTMEDVESDLSRHKNYLDSTVILREILLKNKTFDSSFSLYLKSAARDFQLFPKVGAFEGLKSRGLEILSHDSLRLEITDLFQLGIYNLVAQGREESKNRNITEIMEPYLDRHLTIVPELKSAEVVPGWKGESIPYYTYVLVSGELVKSDKNLLATLEKVIEIRIFKMKKHVRLIAQIKGVIKGIEEEMDRLSK